jgi:rfaE bifunctional protein nucleotidyltransferase chain/domain
MPAPQPKSTPEMPGPASPGEQIRGKIRSIPELGTIVARLRAEGKTVVHAHGVFDVLHIGHVRHLEEAARLGDILVVTITADRHVNKGPGRPIFNEHLRAEMLASLAYVSWVGVNPDSDAVLLLNTLKPSVYAKGAEYARPEDDVTGKIAKEREAVESHGGRIALTSDSMVFSSSNLINQHFSIYERPVQEYLENMRRTHGLEKILSHLDAIKNFRVLLIGDTIIDDYQYVEPMGKSPKEALVATKYIDRELFAGGVIAAANHVAGFCRDVEVVTAFGTGESHEALVRKSLAPNVKLHPLWRDGVPTTRKTRFVETSYAMRKMFEVYFFDDRPLTPTVSAEVMDIVEKIGGDFDCVIVTDFGHGMISKPIIDVLTKHARFLAVNAQTNSANTGFNLVTRYKRAHLICIDGPEARLAIGEKDMDVTTIVSEALPQRIACPRFIVTQGRHGCATFDSLGGGLGRVPALTNTMVDPVGAGDAFLSLASPIAAAGAPLNIVGFFGNVAGAIKIGIVGHRMPVGKAPVVKFVTSLLK